MATPHHAGRCVSSVKPLCSQMLRPKWLVGVGLVGVVAGGGCGGDRASVLEPTPSAPIYCPFAGREAVDVRTLVGMSESAATRRAAAYGCEVAVLERDEEEFSIPDVGRPDRVSVVVNDGIVTGLRGVG